MRSAPGSSRSTSHWSRRSSGCSSAGLSAPFSQDAGSVSPRLPNGQSPAPASPGLVSAASRAASGLLSAYQSRGPRRPLRSPRGATSVHSKPRNKRSRTADHRLSSTTPDSSSSIRRLTTESQASSAPRFCWPSRLSIKAPAREARSRSSRRRPVQVVPLRRRSWSQVYRLQMFGSRVSQPWFAATTGVP